MKKLILFLVLIFAVTGYAQVERASWIPSNTILVGRDASTIQQAINIAVSGQTVLIPDGTYTEAITLKNGVNLVGMDKRTTIIQYTTKNLTNTIYDGDVAVTATLQNLTITRNTDTTAINVYYKNAGSNITMLDCYITGTAYTMLDNAAKLIFHGNIYSTRTFDTNGTLIEGHGGRVDIQADSLTALRSVVLAFGNGKYYVKSNKIANYDSMGTALILRGVALATDSVFVTADKIQGFISLGYINADRGYSNTTAKDLYVRSSGAIRAVGGGTSWINIDNIYFKGSVNGNENPTVWNYNSQMTMNLSSKKIYSLDETGGGLNSSEVQCDSGTTNIYGLKILTSQRRYGAVYAIVGVGAGGTANLFDCTLITDKKNSLRTAGTTAVYNSYLQSSAETTSDGVIIKSGGTLLLENVTLYSSDPTGYSIYSANAQSVNANGLSYNLVPHSNITITDISTFESLAIKTGAITSGGNFAFTDPGTSANSYSISLKADNATTVQEGTIQVMYGADPYMRFSAPNDAGTATAILDLKDQRVVVGSSVAGVDYDIYFQGETNQGNMTYMEDEDRFDFDNDVDVVADLTAGTVQSDATVKATTMVGNVAQQTITLGVGATTFAVTSNVITVTGDGGANTIATITGATVGIYMFIFVDALVTISNNDTHAANTVDLDGANNFTSAADKTLTLGFNGTSWYKIAESTN